MVTGNKNAKQDIMKITSKNFFKQKSKIALIMFCTITLCIAYSCVKNDDIIYGMDDEPDAAIGFSQAEATVIEGDDPFEIEVKASKFPFDDITVELEVVSGDASGVTVIDSNGEEGTTFTINKKEKTVNVKFDIEDDDKYTGDRIITFGLKLVSGDGAFIPEENVGSSERRLNIQFILTVEDDEPVPPSVSFSALKGEVAENATEAHSLTIDFTSTTVRSGAFDIQYSGTAIAGTDYDSEAVDGVQTINFGIGQDEISFEIMPIDNNVVDGDKTIILTITNLSDEFLMGDVSEYMLTITDDDLPIKETAIVAEEDAWTRGRNGSGKSDDNGGNKTDLVLSDGDTDNDLREFYLKFDLKDIDIEKVTEAKIVLTTTRESSWANAETNYGGVTTQSMYHVLDDSWEEMYVTANNQPEAGTEPIATYTSDFLIGETTLSNIEHEFDVTTQVQVETDGTLSVRLNTGNTLGQRIFYSSREHSNGAGPKLIIVESLED